MKKIYGHKNNTDNEYQHDDTHTIEDSVDVKSSETGNWYNTVVYKSTTEKRVLFQERRSFEERFVVKKKQIWTMLEYSVGKEFDIDNIHLKCKEAQGCSCEGCYFNNMDKACISLRKLIGRCAKSLRTDKTAVIFVKVG